VKAVGIDALTQMFEGDKASDDVGDDGELSLRPMIDPFAARTRFFDNFLTCAPGRNRTCDLGIRKPLLYPTELRRQRSGVYLAAT
jgi:hypothetical protein